jgi:biopolymer transport protein ExbD
VAGGALSTGGGRRGGIVGINMTPMVDIMLVLLVIMMVSANFIVSQTMNVDLPKAASGERSPPALAVVSIQPDGSYGYNDVPVAEPELERKLRATFADNPDINVIISGDKLAQHGRVVHVLDLAKTIGITKFAIAVERD